MDMSLVEVHALRAALVLVNEASVIDTEDVQDGGMKVMDVQAVLHGIEPQVVGGAVCSAALHSAASHPHGKSCRVVIAAIAFFAHGCAAEFATPDDEGLVQQSARLEISEQPGDGLVDCMAEGGVLGLDVGMAVPLTTSAAVELHEAHAALDESPGKEAVATEDRGRFVVQSVEFSSGLRFATQIDCPRGFGLHLVGQFVTSDAGFQFRVAFAAGVEVTVERAQQVELVALAPGDQRLSDCRGT